MRSGLTVFPSTVGAGCTPPDRPILGLDYRDDLGSVIAGILEDVGQGDAPLAGALDMVQDTLACDFADPDRDAIVIVVTDGLGLCSAACDIRDDSCQGEALAGSATCLLGQDCCNVELYVLHIGLEAPPGPLLRLAEASVDAGTKEPALFRAPAAGPDPEIEVKQLVERLTGQILARGGKCSFALVLGGQPITHDDLLVWVEGFNHPYCATGDCDEGWILNEGVVSLMPDTCDLIENRDCPNVRFNWR
jgi:hypothetical protein